MKIYTLFQQQKRLLRNSLDTGTVFCKAAVVCRKIVDKAKYWIGTRQILNIRGLGPG